MSRREDKLQLRLHALLTLLIAVLFVVAMGELRFWFVGLVFGAVVGFPASGAMVWFWVDVLKRPLVDDGREPPAGGDRGEDARLQRASAYLTSCGTMTLAKALAALKIARRMEDRQTLLNIWATHAPNEVREYLLEQFAAEAQERTQRDGTRGGSAN